ncbi:TATA-box binding protein [Babesia divergens]|uniref:TATA-box binding protein n=1 Tax=Babesia divergens TaxID=32595 RepID=A0AAD9GCL3_BABDI|nr:TATA-box binding protein [Babesia divergens]
MSADESIYSNLDFLNFLPSETQEDEDHEEPLSRSLNTQYELSVVDKGDVAQQDDVYDDSEMVLLDTAKCINPGNIIQNIAKYACFMDDGLAASCSGMPVVQNIVASVHLGREVDLREIAISTRNAEYNPRKFNALILRLQNPKCTGLVFRTGRLMVTGSRTVEHAILGAKRMAKLIRRELGEEILFKEFKVENIIATFNCNVPIRLERLYDEHKAFCNYEPELFAGLVYRFALREREEAVLLIFVSGNVIVTGCRSLEEIRFIYTTMAPILREFKD